MGVIGWWIAALAAPLDGVRQFVLPLTWLWPVLIWSQMGTREARHNTGAILFASAYPVKRQLPAVWLAGIIINLVTLGNYYDVALRDFGLLVGALALTALAWDRPEADR